MSVDNEREVQIINELQNENNRLTQVIKNLSLQLLDSSRELALARHEVEFSKKVIEEMVGDVADALQQRETTE